MKLTSLRALFGAALVGTVCSAQALTLNLTGFAQPNGVQTATVGTANDGVARNVYAGGFKGSLSGAGSFDTNNFFTYCVQLTQSFQFGSPVKAGSGAATTYVLETGSQYFSQVVPQLTAGASTVIDRLGKLFTVLGGVGDPGDAQTSAAIQLAVWESIYEFTIGTPTHVDTGNFAATNVAAATRAQANGYLSAANNLSSSIYSISVLKSNDAQDFLLLQRVPEPASLALTGLALAALVMSRRRRA